MGYLQSVFTVVNFDYLNSPQHHLSIKNGVSFCYRESAPALYLFDSQQKILIIPSHVGRILNAVKDKFTENFLIFTLRHYERLTDSTPKKSYHLFLKKIDAEIIDKIKLAILEIFLKFKDCKLTFNPKKQDQFLIENRSKHPFSQYELAVSKDLVQGKEIWNNEVSDETKKNKRLRGKAGYQYLQQLPNNETAIPEPHKFRFICYKNNNPQITNEHKNADYSVNKYITNLKETVAEEDPNFKRFKNTKKANSSYISH